MPDPELVEQAKRRKFTARYKLEILEKAEACTRPGEIGELLRREGLYTSHLTYWRKQQREGALKELGRSGGYHRPTVGGNNSEMRNRKMAGHVLDEMNMRSAAPANRAPVSAGSASPPAWFPDPTGRHGQRWWDGSRWTEKVMDGDIPAQADPI